MDKIKFRDNSFDVIRLLAAVQVIIGHSIIHLQLNSNPAFDSVLGWFPGVVVFFAISGFLITASADRSTSNKEYAMKRLLRIYPALLAVFLINFVIVLLLYNYNFNWKEIATWVGTQTTFFQWYTPDFLKGYGTGAINGSLWTIIVELQFYLFSFLFHKKMKKLAMSKWLLIICIFLSINIIMPIVENYFPIIIYGLLLQTFIPYIYIYLIGAFIYTFSDKLLPILISNLKYIVSLYVIICVVNEFMDINIGEHYSPAEGILLPLIVISLGYAIGQHKLSADLSYGLYLYHMVVINALVELGITGTGYSLVMTYVLTVILALFSWYFIEKPFIKRKNSIIESRSVIS